MGRGGQAEAGPLRVLGWQALLLILGLALIAVVAETALRLSKPFMRLHSPANAFVPGVGLLLKPNAEMRSTNFLDFWAVSRTNSLGFLDREPPSPERAAASCHISVIGDSFVEARHVSIADKVQVRLEELAARELPHLDVTASAFGMTITGQVSQLAYYNEYARRLRPKLVVLVFVPNDYVGNFPLWMALQSGWSPEHLPFVSAARAEDGRFRLRPPDPEYQRFTLPRLADPAAKPQRVPLGKRVNHALLRESYFYRWLHSKHRQLFRYPSARHKAQRLAWLELLRRRPAYAPLLDGWRPVLEDTPSFFALFAKGNDSAFLKEALAFTAFGIDEFKRRTERDGAALAILAIHQTHDFGGGAFARMNAMAAERGVPVIDQADFIRRQGAELRDAQWAHDSHWSPLGHQWAAKALLEHLKENQDVCGRSAPSPEELLNG